jgi:hypothetical protein
MASEQRARLTWNKAFVLVTSVFLISTATTMAMRSQRLYLAPPLSPGSTFLFYVAAVFVTTFLAFALCLKARPTGARSSSIALLVWISVLMGVYLAILPTVGGTVWTAIECQPGSRSGLVVHHDCLCVFESIEGARPAPKERCALDGLALLPFMRLSEPGDIR